ncbi:MAG: TonB-dependent receptor [Candidatus Kuenenia sp.]|nr:TonB-dependent receptor [Candidatus Kuenenia hertensis]
MKFRNIVIFMVVASVFNFAHKCCAEVQEGGEADMFNLGQVVVASTKTERTVKNVSSTVTVITQEEISQSTAKGVIDIIKQVPGVYAYDQYGAGIEGHISMRGFAPYGSERVLIMVDGVPINSGNDGYVQQSRLPSLDNIEKIEIVKGPSSSLYGPFAMGGVINIITQKGQEKTFAKTDVGFGRFNEQKYRLETGGTSGIFNYRIGSGYRNGDGYRENTGFIRRDIQGKLSLDVDKTSNIIFDFDVQNTDVEYAGSLTESQYDEDRKQASSLSSGDLESHRVSLIYNKNINEFNHFKGQVFTTRYDYDYPGSYHYKADIDGWGGELQYTLSHPLAGMENSFILGTSLKRDEIDYSTYYGDTLSTDDNTKPLFWGAYVQDELTPFKPLTLTLGGRFDLVEYDYNVFYDSSGAADKSKSFDEFSPKFGILYRLTEDISLYGNTGKAFMPPSAYRMFTSRYRNPELTPETAWNYEIGVKALFFQRLSVQVAGYLMNVEDEIYLGSDDIYHNTGKTRHKGIESELGLYLFSGFSIFSNLTFQEAKFTDYTVGSTSYDDNWLPHAPKRTVAYGVRYEHPIGISYSISGNYRSSAYTDDANTYTIPGRTIWDTRIDYEHDFKFANVGFYTGVTNLFDKNYYDYRTASGGIYPAYPRDYMVGFYLSKEF